MLMDEIAYDPFRAMEAASADNDRFVAALNSGIGPKRFRWSGNFGGDSKRGWAMAEASFARTAELEASKVDRDGCTYCGVRADLGCKHNRYAGAQA